MNDEFQNRLFKSNLIFNKFVKYYPLYIASALSGFYAVDRKMERGMQVKALILIIGFSFTETIVSDEDPVCEVWQKKLPLIKIANDKIVSFFMS